MTDLCVSCNLCCNGSIFARVPVTADERARLPEGPQFFERDGKLRMALPCPKLGANGMCGCYDVRPQTCSDYNCKLSKATNAGDIAGDMALEIVAEIKQAQARALSLAAQAMGKTRADFAGRRVGEVFRTLSKIEAAGEANSYVAEQARVHREFYDTLVRFHLQDNYRR